MIQENTIPQATHVNISSSLYETMLTSAMYHYYRVFPKVVMQDFAIFYCEEDMAPELKLELEVMLGINIKYENIEASKLSEHLKTSESKDYLPVNYSR